jgi:DNA-binding NarL/FixJ family response regulator
MARVIRFVRKAECPEVKTRVLIADDHRIIRDGLRVLINRHNDMMVAGEAETGREAVRLAGMLEPDVVIMDITMPEIDGIKATRLIMADGKETKIIGLSMRSDRGSVMEMLESGACGYLLKDTVFDELAEAIRQVRKNNIYLSSGISPSVAREFLERKISSRSGFQAGTAEPKAGET